jgi:hypothetical protein
MPDPAQEPAIAVLPYGGRLGRKLAGMPLDDLNWPLGRPARLSRGTVADLSPQDHLIVYPKTAMHFQLSWGCRARVSMMVVEPHIMHGHHLRMLRLTHRRFFRVFSYDRDFLARVPNGLFLPFGTTWVPEWRGLSLEKTAHMSLIASAKRDHPGHKLRHSLVDFVRASHPEVAIMGRGYTPFETKADGLAPYRYSVVIENVQQPNYFTEKLIDAILCDCVPIYWGCPNIGDFMDTRGMILCQNEAEMRTAIAAASEADYAARLPALRAIKETAAGFDHLETRAAEALRASF